MDKQEVVRHPSYNNRFRTSLDNGEQSPDICTDQPLSVSGTILSSEKTWYDRRLQFAGVSHPDKTTRSISFESNPDDVFVDVGHYDGLYVNGKTLIKPTTSTTSTASVLPNPYNKFNHRMHSIVWCACCLYFVLICCFPAVYYMQESDKAFRHGDDFKAMRTGKMASLMFAAGTIIALAVYVGILFLVIFFTAYNV